MNIRQIADVVGQMVEESGCVGFTCRNCAAAQGPGVPEDCPPRVVLEALLKLAGPRPSEPSSTPQEPK